MQFVYPIQAILLYLSLLFAPADTERIVFHGVDRSGVLIRDAVGWNLAGPEGNTVVTLDGTRLISKGSNPGVIDLVNLVGGVAGHDWEKQATLSLADDQKLDAVLVERSADGLKVRHDRGKEGIYAYTVAYVRKSTQSGATCNVLGAVKQPGIVPLAEGDTLSSILLKAGGATGKTPPHRVSLLRGEPGEKISHFESYALAPLLAGRGPDPKVLDHDTLYVAPTVLITIAADALLTVDGATCAPDDLAARLRDRVEAGARSATIAAARGIPHHRVTDLLDTCVAAGMSAHQLKIESGAETD